MFGLHFERIKTLYKFDGVAIILYNEADNSTTLSVDIFTKFQTVSEQDKICKKKKKKKEKKRKKRSKKTLEQNVLYKMKCSQSIIKGEIGSQILCSSFSSS